MNMCYTRLKYEYNAFVRVLEKLPILAYCHDIFEIRALEMHAFVNEYVRAFITAANDTFVNQ